ncbi:hypothetical protein SAMN02746095_03353 [Acidocella aminolytica 101 = DSM 11237]|nr:hypothetical protein SAMN02746095_03353 [Acidocella aminolytica 101 = DSM 11237]
MKRFHQASLVPDGFAIEGMDTTGATMVATVRATSAASQCPACGASIKEIVLRTGHSRKLVRSVIRGQRTDVFRVRQNSLEAHLPWLDEQRAAPGCAMAPNSGGSSRSWASGAAFGSSANGHPIAADQKKRKMPWPCPVCPNHCTPHDDRQGHSQQSRDGDDRHDRDRRTVARRSPIDRRLPQHDPQEKRERTGAMARSALQYASTTLA